VSREDVDRVIETMAQEMKETPAKLRQTLHKNRGLPSLEREVKRTKCLDWICSKAHIS
jgi:hypothetical protein